GPTTGSRHPTPGRRERRAQDQHTGPRVEHRADDRGHAQPGPMIYLDTSAAYKLLSREPEAEAVEALFAGGAGLLSSRLLEIELHAAVDRRGGSHEDVESKIGRAHV